MGRCGTNCTAYLAAVSFYLNNSIGRLIRFAISEWKGAPSPSTQVLRALFTHTDLFLLNTFVFAQKDATLIRPLVVVKRRLAAFGPAIRINVWSQESNIDWSFGAYEFLLETSNTNWTDAIPQGIIIGADFGRAKLWICFVNIYKHSSHVHNILWMWRMYMEIVL